MRRLLAGTLALTTVAVLSACRPEPWGQVGIRRSNGVAQLSVALCPGDKVTSIAIYDVDRSSRYIITAPTGGAELVTVGLFEVPVGWQVAESTLTELRPDGTYDVSMTTSRLNDTVLPRFTAKDIDNLHEDQVLGRAGPSESRAMSTAELEKMARKDC